MLSKRDAHKLLRSVQFPGEEDYLRDLKLATSSKAHRRKLIRQDGVSEEKKAAAVIELQRIWRGYVTRVLLFSILNQAVSTHGQYAGSRFQYSKRGLRDVLSTPSKSPVKKSSHHVSVTSTVSETQTVVSQQGLRERARARLESYYQKYLETGIAEPISFEEFCVHYIQNWWHRIHRKRSLPVSETPSGVKSVTIAVSPQRSRTPKKKRSLPFSREEAASIIQGAWRRHIDKQVYRYYRDLINFRCHGDPSMMLRCINPREAKLLDAAGGIHIKFRLAGSFERDRFPPNIYYKIFTHRNIVDMCANSPKDYTKSGAKRLAAKEVHNRIGDSTDQRRGQCEVQKMGWYERIENNGWRLVSDRLIIQSDQDPVTWETSKKKVDFKHSKLKRKEDVEKRKRKKKLDWLKKVYKEGMLQSKIGDSGASKLIEGATAGMVATVEKEGPEAVEDWEVDELLDWTNGLNFDDYLDEWKGIGTSSGSEKCVEERLTIKTSKQDPYEFAIDFPRTPTASRTDNAKAVSLHVS